MLKSLTIKNLAVIESVDLAWSAGFTVLTGETGAGKSILIDAIGLIIGTRADVGLIRSGADRAEVTAEFLIGRGSSAHTWLVEQMLDDADEPLLLVIRRLLQAGGRGRIFINGTPVTLTQLRELGASLIDVFGQSESQTLLQADIQRSLLDDFGQLHPQHDETAQAAAKVHEIDNTINALKASAARDPAQLQFLRFQVDELDALQLSVDELETLEQDHRRLAGAGRLLQDGGQAQELLYDGDDSLYDRLSQARNLIEGLVTLEPSLAHAVTAINDAQAQVADAAETLRQTLSRMDLDPDRLTQIEARLQAIHDLARKHRVRTDELPTYHGQLRAQLDSVEHSAEKLEALTEQRARAVESYRRSAAVLSQARARAAEQFAQSVTAVVQTLGMPHAQLLCVVETDPSAPVSRHGLDQIRLDFTANAGQPPRALAKVASGGELSRISLAIQVAALRQDSAATMVFDEIDTGISGAVAQIVGQRLRELGKDRQVLCITHLAQVAAQGHHHLGIRKTTRDGATFTQVENLSEKARVTEIARMQGGVSLQALDLEHAKAMLARAANPGTSA